MFSRFIAAFASRSWLVPQARRLHLRTDNRRSASFCPHPIASVSATGHASACSFDWLVHRSERSSLHAHERFDAQAPKQVSIT